MNILLLGRYNESEILTGPEKVAKRIFEKITRKEKSVFIDYFYDGKKYGFYKKLFGREVICRINESNVMRLGIFTLFFYLFRVKPKIIHIITFERFALVSFLYKIFFRTRIVYNVHGLMIFENHFLRKQNWFYNLKDKIAENILIKYSDILMLPSNNVKLFLDKYYKKTKSRIEYISNGVDIEFNKVREKKIFGEKGFLKIVFIGSPFSMEKGFSFLKKSLEQIKKRVELYIVDKKRNSSIISIENKFIDVIFLNKMPTLELADFIKDKDVFISASNYETFSLTSVECMAAGVIPLLTKETGASELIEEGVNGFLFYFGDNEKLTEILSELSENIELRKNISWEARKIYGKLNWGKIADDYSEIYKSI